MTTNDTPQRVDVERLTAKWLDAADRVEAGTRNLDSPPDRMFVLSGESRAAAYRGCAKDLSEALPALLQQVAELRTSRDAYKHDAEALLQINSGTRAALEAAERAREGAVELLREAAPEINELSNIYYSEFSNTRREKETEALHNRIASFLAANGVKP